MPPQLLVCVPTTLRDKATISKTGPHDCRVPAIAQGSKAKPVSRVIAAPREQSERWSDTKGGQQLSSLGPHWGAASSNFVSKT
jgi:hypothetical protein